MRKRTISDLLRYRFWSKLFMFLAGFIIAGLVFQFVIIKNPKETKAATVDACSYRRGDTYLIEINWNQIIAQYYNGARWIWVLYPAIPIEQTDDVIIDGCEVNFGGENTFKSLTVRNSGKASHQTLGSGDNVTSWKKVDVTLSNNLTLESGGTVDVNGRGHLGGGNIGSWGTTQVSCNNQTYSLDGAGFGGTVGNQFGARGGGSAGASYGGMGGQGGPDSFLTATVGTYGEAEITTFWAGSGGGAIFRNCNGTNGGNGGGRVRVKAKQIAVYPGSVISANGNDGTVNAGSDIKGGGGSGGSIILEFEKSSTNLIPQVSGGWGRDTDNKGAQGTIRYINVPGTNDYSTISSDNVTIFANGGSGQTSGDWGSSGGGGGGRITLKRIVPQIASIKKTLEAIDRGGTAVFNPYALKLGDRIKINFTITNWVAGQEVTVRDEILKLPDGSVRCEYIPGYFGWREDPDFLSNPTVAYDGSIVTMKFIRKSEPTADSTVFLVYQCVVQ